MESLKKIDKKYIRLAALVLAFVALGVALFVPAMPNRMLVVGICLVAAVVAVGFAFWYNNNFTAAAKDGQEQLEILKNARALTDSSKLDNILEGLKGIKAGTWARLILTVIVLINLILTALGRDTIKVNIEDLYTIVSYGLAILIGFLDYFKRNSITLAAQTADEYIRAQGNAEEEQFEYCEKIFDLSDAAEILENLVPEEITEEEDYIRFKTAFDKLAEWTEQHPDEVEKFGDKVCKDIYNLIKNAKEKLESMKKQ